VAVITKLVKGFDADYSWKQMSAAAGDYFLVKGAPKGRWSGAGAAELGLEPGLARKAYRQLIAEHLDPRDGETRLGRAPGNAAARAEKLYQEKLAAEPYATLRRQFELRREAAREARQGPPRDDFVVTMTDGEPAAFDAHAGWLRSLLTEGFLIVSGPCLGKINTGVLIFAPSEAARQRIVAREPVTSGGYMRGELRPYRLGLLCGRDG